MRHRNKTNSLGRTASHRKAMLANMATSLVMHKRIKTTVAKAKVLRTYIEPIITKAKVDSTHNRRTAFRYLKNKYAVSELFRAVAPRIADRPGGYTRILKIGHRVGDNASICYIELVDFNTTYAPNEKATKKKRRSRRGGGSKGKQEEQQTLPNVETFSEVTEQIEDEKVVEKKQEEAEKKEEKQVDDEKKEAEKKEEKQIDDEKKEAEK